MTKNLTLTLIIVVVIGIVAAIVVSHLGQQLNNDEDKEELRRELAAEQKNIMILRMNLSHERKFFQTQINKSVARYDSLELVSKSQKAKLLLEIKRLKSSTVKELENEADSLYNSAVNKH